MTAESYDKGCISQLFTFLVAKQSSPGLWWGTMSPQRLPRRTRSQEHTLPALLSTPNPQPLLSPSYSTSNPKTNAYSTWSQGSLATSKGETHSFVFLCQTKHGYSQCHFQTSRFSKLSENKINGVVHGGIPSALKTELVSILWLFFPLSSSPFFFQKKRAFIIVQKCFQKRFHFLMTKFIKTTQ